MTTLEEGIYAHLTGQAAFSELAGDRLYPQTLPQNPTYPAVRYLVASARLPMAHDGPGDLKSDRIQFDCYGASKQQVKQLVNAVRRILNGFRGTMGGVAVHGVFFLNEVDLYGDQSEVYRTSVDFKFNYKVQD
jgi:hypothetical protein